MCQTGMAQCALFLNLMTHGKVVLPIIADFVFLEKYLQFIGQLVKER